MDLSKLSDQDLDALEAGDMTKLSEDALSVLTGEPAKRSDQTTTGERFAQGLRDPLDGGAQLLTKMLPEGVVRAGNQANNWLADKTGLVGRLPEGGVDQQVREREAAYQARRGDTGFDGARLAGNVLSPVNLGMAAAAPLGAATTGGRMALSAGLGAGSAALNPVTGGKPEEFWQDKAGQAATGAAFGAAVPAVGAGLSRLISPRASINPQVQMLRDRGVKPTIGQTLGGWANKAEEKATSLPIMGDAIAASRQRAQNQFNNAALNETVRPIGGRVEGIGHSAVDDAHQQVSRAYDRAKTSLGGLRLDNQFMQDLSQLRQMASALPPQLSERFERTLNDMVVHRAPNGAMTAETFKKIDADLGEIATKFGQSPTAAGKDFGNSIKQLQSLLTQQARRSNPQASRQMSQADAAFARLARTENAAGRAVNTEGVFTPGQFNLAIKSGDRSARRNQTARGKALMQDLGSAGQQVLGNRVGDSGTAGRLAMGALGLGTAMVHPGIPAALVGGAAMYTPPMQALLRGSVASRPAVAQPIAEAVRRGSPLLAPAGGALSTYLSE